MAQPRCGAGVAVAPSDADIAHALECECSRSPTPSPTYEQAGLSSEVDQRSGIVALAMHERTVMPDDLKPAALPRGAVW